MALCLHNAHEPWAPWGYFLLTAGIDLEEFGGEIQTVEISAKQGLNLDSLQEAIIAQADMLELRGDVTGHVEAVVLESSTHPGRGYALLITSSP